jgi:hypothetical protein
MNFLTAVGISVGVLAGLWMVASSAFGLLTFAGFLSWASFYAAGGKVKGLKDTLILNFAGVVWGYIMVQLASLFTPVAGASAGLGLAVGLGAAGMCWQARIPLLAFIPGAFIGCSTFFGANLDFSGSVLGLICGGLLGYASEQGGTFLSRIGKQ